MSAALFKEGGGGLTSTFQGGLWCQMSKTCNPPFTPDPPPQAHHFAGLKFWLGYWPKAKLKSSKKGTLYFYQVRQIIAEFWYFVLITFNGYNHVWFEKVYLREWFALAGVWKINDTKYRHSSQINTFQQKYTSHKMYIEN